MPTSQKLKTYFRLFISFLKSMLNFESAENKDQSQSLGIMEIINCKTGSYLSVQKAIFHSTIRKTHVNGSQTMLRSARDQFHTTLSLI